MLAHTVSPPVQSRDLRVALLAPLVVLLVELGGEGNVGDNDDVEGAGSILGSLAGVTTGVVLVLAQSLGLPGVTVLGDADVGLGGGAGGRSAWWFAAWSAICVVVFEVIVNGSAYRSRSQRR